jgi:putative transposase
VPETDANASMKKTAGLVASMSRKGNCYDNATMEAFWSSLQNELVHRRRFATRADARTAIFDHIDVFSNRTRRHSSLGYHSPRLRGLFQLAHSRYGYTFSHGDARKAVDIA